MKHINAKNIKCSEVETMKELPSVFANKLENNINNVQETFFSNSKGERKSVEEVLDSLYNSGRYVYKASMEIVTKSGKSIEKIALRTKDYLLTLSNKKINIKDIISINEVKK